MNIQQQYTNEKVPGVIASIPTRVSACNEMHLEHRDLCSFLHTGFVGL